MRYVPIYEINDRMILAKHIKDGNDRVLLTSGQRISHKMIPRLKNFGIYYVCIEDKWSDDIQIDNVVTDVTKSKSINALEKLDLDKVFECASTIVDEMAKSSDLANDMTLIKEYDLTTYEHSLNVAINAVTVAMGLGMSYTRMNNIAVGAMLHDIGKREIPIEIISKKGKLDEYENSLIRQHPEIGYKILSKDILIPASIKEVVHQHHENWDGTGYPRGLKHNEIYELASIVHICDVYDALLSKRSYKDAFSYTDTISILKEQSGKQFNPYYVKAFFRLVPIYHRGVEVRLSNNSKALVIHNNHGDMLNPVVRLSNNKEIDLRQSSLTIIS